MSEIETLGILDEIQSLVSDSLQVVSYKWLSRNFLVSSNAAKRLLQQFVEKNGSGLEVVYSLSGWLKNNPSVYHITLVSRPKLVDAKRDFDDPCSVQVYSVQACIPKDPAALWNAEFVQAEELFKQSPTVDNCLRDNRFCGVTNSFVNRNMEGTPVSTAAPQAKSARVPGPSRSNFPHQTATVPQPEQRKIQQSSPKSSLQSPKEVKDNKSDSHGTGVHEQGNKPAANKEKVLQLPANKKKGQNDIRSSGTGGSLASMWGRASAKPKPSCASAETNICIPTSTEPQVCGREAVEDGSSDDDGCDVNFKRASNGDGSRKRRVVFDFSDEEDEYKDAVSLASPDPPKRQSSLGSKQSSKTSVLENNNLDFDELKENKPKVKEEKDIIRESNQPLKEESLVVSKGRNTRISSLDKTQSRIPEDDASTKDKVTDEVSNSPKRRKVLKTQIDERGREVTEVVWEDGAAERKPDSTAMKKADNNTVINTVNRPPAAKKLPAVGGAAPPNLGGKAGNKKAGTKDPKQGNILSFFKKA